MSKLGVVAAVVAAFLVAGLVGSDAEARANRTTRTVRMKAADADTSAAGRMRFRTRRGTTFMSASFAHLAPDTMHTVRWDAVGQDGGQFVTDHRGRAKVRHMAVPEGAAGDVPQVSVVDEDGDPVLTCDPDSMPAMHHQSADHHDMGGMMSGDHSMCSQECMDHCANSGTCDAQCHEDHGCTDSCCCSGGTMDGTSGSQHCDSGMQGDSTTGDTDHASHHDASTMGGSGSSGSGMMGGGWMHSGGGMMKK